MKIVHVLPELQRRLRTQSFLSDGRPNAVRFRLTAVALLPIVGLATFVGTRSVDAAAGAPVNLVINGSFEVTTAPTST